MRYCNIKYISVVHYAKLSIFSDHYLCWILNDNKALPWILITKEVRLARNLPVFRNKEALDMKWSNNKGGGKVECLYAINETIK